MALLDLSDAAADASRIAELEREVAKLRKIQAALIGRVERSIDGQGSAFSLFQTAIVLEAQVRARTLDLERSYLDAATAREQAETARLRLLTAIESFSEGFALFDAEDRIVQFNRPYLSFWPGISAEIKVGMPFAEIARLAVERKCIIEAYRDPEGWLRRRLQQHAECKEPSVHALGDGRWMQVSERRMIDGGIVAVYTDITNLKRLETRVREAELGKKTDLLQATLDNIFEGVAVYDDKLFLVAWNNELLKLLDLPQRIVRRGARFVDLRRHNAALGAGGITHPEFFETRSGWHPLKFEHEWVNGRLLKIERNPMPDGGFILTFADVTAQRRSDEALRDGERRIRTITDALPALISYVDSDQRYQFVNKAYGEWLERPVGRIIGCRMVEVMAPEIYERHKGFVEHALSGELAEFETEITPDGTASPRFARVSLLPHISEDGQKIGFYSLMQDITEQRRINAAITEANESLERRVGERTAALTRLNAQLQQEIRERRQIELALQIAKSEAEQANLGKTKFLAAASHDLLQPLHSARLFISALGEFRHTAQNRVLIENADSSLHAVEDLLGALLDISKLDAGVVSPEIVDFPVGSLLGPLSTEHKGLANEHGLTLRYVPSSAVVRTDIRLLRRILQNFLANAIRYTASGRVLLGCRRLQDGLRIEVCDTGPGIPADKLEEIFEEFRQLHPHNGRGEGGLGLGLAIVKRAAKALELPVYCASRVGHGSSFGIVVPYGASVVAAQRTSAPPPAPAGHIQARIIVIDDQPRVLAGMEALLCGWGCTVWTAASGREASAILQKLRVKPDIVIADFHLGQSPNGVRAIDGVRRSSGTELPGIVITADQSVETQELVKQHGYWMLAKPIKPAQLRAVLNAALSAAPLNP
jgi:PAS domain S-box-containing protein